MQKLWKKLTPWLDRKPSQVKFSTRFIAYVIDWAIGGVVAGFPAVLLYAAITKRSDMFSDLYVFPALGYPTYFSYIAGFSCLLVAIIYYVYIPYKKYPGQTLGKKWMKIKIMKMNGDPLDLKTLFIRQICGLMLIEGVSMVVSNYLRQMLTLATGIYLEYYLLAIGSLITVISCVLVFNSPSKRAIHDYMAKTRVALETEEYKPVDNKKIKSKHKKKHQ
ncbi:MAG: RDD family protein [Longibaculum sp.]